MDEVKYCIFCGEQNKSNDSICSKCGKDLNPKENLFKEYLIRKSKEQFISNSECSLFDAIEGYIKSHLYGTLITIMVVGVAVTASVNVLSAQQTDYILTDHRPVVQQVITDNTSDNQYITDNQDTTNQNHQYDQSDYNAIESLIYNYVQAVAYGGDYSSYVVPATYNIETNFGYDFSFIDDIEETWRYEDVYIERMTSNTDLGMKLANDGYLLGQQTVIIQNVNTGGSDYYNALTIRLDGQWYVVEFINYNML